MYKPQLIIGRVENVAFPSYGLEAIPARIDTGATISTVWASGMTVKNGLLEFYLFDKSSKYFNGQKLTTKNYKQRVVASSNGARDKRFVIKTLVSLHGRKINASFTLANRSTQTYPVLVGRNILRGKFLVDVKKGDPLISVERRRRKELQETIDLEEKA